MKKPDGRTCILKRFVFVFLWLPIQTVFFLPFILISCLIELIVYTIVSIVGYLFCRKDYAKRVTSFFIDVKEFFYRINCYLGHHRYRSVGHYKVCNWCGKQKKWYE